MIESSKLFTRKLKKKLNPYLLCFSQVRSKDLFTGNNDLQIVKKNDNNYYSLHFHVKFITVNYS